MIEILTIIGITVGAFIGTNLDNLLLLVAFYARYKDQKKIVTAGYICGMILIVLIFFTIGEGGDFIPLHYLGMLGIVPMIIGVLALIQLLRPKKAMGSIAIVKTRNQKAVFFAVLLTQLSNGADTIITFSVFLADSTDKLDYFIAGTFLVMVLLFSVLAKYSLKHPKLSDFLDRFGRYATPIILILVGWYILGDTATDLG